MSEENRFDRIWDLFGFQEASMEEEEVSSPSLSVEQLPEDALCVLAASPDVFRYAPVRFASCDPSAAIHELRRDDLLFAICGMQPMTLCDMPSDPVVEVVYELLYGDMEESSYADQVGEW